MVQTPRRFDQNAVTFFTEDSYTRLEKQLRYSEIMKKNLWIWAIAALSMAACTSEDVPTTEQIVTENDFESPDGRVVVQLGAESSPSVTVSRAPIEDITALQELGIFAINRSAVIDNNDFEKWPDYINNCLLMNVKAAGTSNEPLDNDVNKGKRLTLYNTEAIQPGYVYYYPIQGGQNYDFYGYQPRVDGDKLSLDKEGKIKVGMDLSKGDVDLITGEAAKAKTVNEDTLYVTEASETVAATKGSGIINGYNAKYVRKIKYSNWIIDESQKLTNNKLDSKEKDPFIPNIGFKHRLTKLNFQIITAKEQAGDGSQSDTEGGDRQDATQLRVSDIILDNVPCTADLTIGENMPIEFGDLDGSVNMVKNTDDDYTDIWDENETDIIPQNYEEGTYTSAGYVMVAPTDEIPEYAKNPYQIKLKVKSTNTMGIPQTQDVVLDLKDKNGTPLAFEAGKSYNIRIALYALQGVSVSAELTPWDTNTEDAYIPVE